MILYTKIEEIKSKIQELKIVNSIGFVPTMGALHKGHLSLVKKCVIENDICVVSIFVNPTQFNDKTDLDNYPSELKKDIKLLKTAKCDIVFAPDIKEMYPTPDKRLFEFNGLDNIMEGKHRPGHFNGVAQIVTKLFDIIAPTNAYFGQKDFQQLAIIKYIIKKYNYPVNIVSCPTIREPDGLAMSSRNTLLNPEQRKIAPEISKALFYLKKNKNNLSLDEARKYIFNSINKFPEMKLEYFEIVDRNTLKSVNNFSKNEIVLCIAVKIGNVRLIDNVIISS